MTGFVEGIDREQARIRMGVSELALQFLQNAASPYPVYTQGSGHPLAVGAGPASARLRFAAVRQKVAGLENREIF